MAKAIALMSGGLDSTLAAKIVKDEGVEVLGLHLVSPFGCREEVSKCAAAVGIPVLFRDKGESYLDLLKNPRFGYGRNMNPCIDCRIFMFQLADVVRQEVAADFIVTGEVVGQRPMSQQRHSMDLIDRNSPLEGLVLRPLSAHCLPPTLPEQKGWVQRENLYEISGRSRKEQFELAKSFGIEAYATPGGGCLLTESAFSARLRDFFSHEDSSSKEVPYPRRLAQSQLLRLGRHFRVSEKFKVIVGRNEGENNEMEKLWRNAGGTFFFPSNFDGPSAVGIGAVNETERRTVGRMIVRYSRDEGQIERSIGFDSGVEKGVFEVPDGLGDEELNRWRL